MAGVQAGDIINFAKIAWEVYRYGWSDELSATTQYREFFNDVRGLANNLNLLTRVVGGATAELRGQGLYDVEARWDRKSLYQIIGDYHNTLAECNELIRENARCNIGSNPLQNIEWNVLVQPRADQLRQRIALHNSKVLQVLKPFEIDLLSRVQQDIRNMHSDIADRITAVHNDLRRVMGVIIPNLDQELNQRQQRTVCMIQVPSEISDRIRSAALNERPEYITDTDFQLEELSDAFVLNFDRATVNFRHGLEVTERTPPLDQYINLLKCVWVLQKIQILVQGQTMGQESHWPSFVCQLEQNLSSECIRFRQDLLEPRIIPSQVRGDLFSIWPDREPVPLVNVVTRDEMMLQLLEAPLQGNGSTIERKVKLLRRMGSDGRRYRIIISGSEQIISGRPRKQTEVIDFDITSVLLTPLYALPSSARQMPEMLLTRDERIAKMTFTKMSHILKFQQAVTGFKPYEGYYQFNALVSFVVSQKEPMCERASIQLWVPKEVDGTLVTTSDAATDAAQMAPQSRPNSMAMSESSLRMPPSFTRDTISNPFRRSGDRLSSSPPHQPSLPPIPQRQSPSPSSYQTPWPRQASPSPLGTTPPDFPAAFMASPLQSPTRKPVGQPPSNRSSTHSSAWSYTTKERTSSFSSVVSTSAVSTTSNSSSSDGRTTISKGSTVTGFLHRRPPKPLLVLFTQNSEGKTSFVTIQIDEETSINPDRCDCRRSGRDGMSCKIAAIEKRKGSSHLEARRFESTGRPDQGFDWNVARLALNNPQSTSDAFIVKKLNRVSIMFPDGPARELFCGTPQKCQCKNLDQGSLIKCLNAGHRGLWGKVQEIYRRQTNAYHQARYGAQQHVVNGVMAD
ncbi:hypothetical protein BGZ63DRAFT_60696 [Mariannaea sp. PMI_226]|nr:hypothetical protein BGZ63DRAFT_60696 [Mariannaea sp. PMI_226]